MALDTDLEALLDQRHPPGKRCRVCWALDGLPDDTRALFEKVLATAAPATEVADAFKRRDWPVEYTSVSRHRQRCV